MTASDGFSLGGLTEEQAAVYDRQLRVWGVEAQRRMGQSKFFVAGLTGLASEACKNIVLAGVGTVTLLDDGAPAGEAAPGNFLAASAAADDPSLTAAEATAATLREMNPFGEVRVVKPSAPVDSALSAGGFAGITAETIAGHDAVLVCGAPLLERERINDLARETGAKFFAGSCRGSSADFFVDLGDAFEYVVKSAATSPADAPAPSSSIIASFVPLRVAMASKWSDLGVNREGGIRRVNKLAGAMKLCSAFERRAGRAPTLADVPALVASVAEAERENGVKAGWLPAATVEDYVGSVGESPAAAAVVGGILGQELLRAATGVGEPVRNAFFFTTANSQGTVEYVGCEGR